LPLIWTQVHNIKLSLHYKEQTNTASGQIGFITYLALPLFAEMTKVFPKMQVCCDQMLLNKENWQKIEAKQKQK
jgi:hypothetical protein